MIRNLLILALLSVLPLGVFAHSHQPSDRMAEYREAIGLDYSMPDYSVTTIDEKKIGSRLANILRYYEEASHQNHFSRKISAILAEQNEAFEYAYPEIKKQKLVKIEKSADEITIIYKLWLDKNPANIKQTEICYRFKDGVSESNTVNEMFSLMSRYVKAREQLNN